MSLMTAVESDCELIVRALHEQLGDDLVAVALFSSHARGDSLYDTDGYLAERLQRIRDIIAAAGLYRIGERGNFGWRWQREPTPGKIWVLDWEGYRELP